MLCLMKSKIAHSGSSRFRRSVCTRARLRWTATRSVQRWPAHWGSIVRHQPPAGRDVRCLTTTLSANQTAVYSAVPGTAEPGLRTSALSETAVWAPPVCTSRDTISSITPDNLLAASMRGRFVAEGSSQLAVSSSIPRGTLHNSRWHSEITALCRPWLCAAAALDETNDRTVYSKIGDRSIIRSEPIPIYGDRYRIRISTKIGAFSNRLRSLLSKGPNWIRTEVAKDRSRHTPEEPKTYAA